MIPAGRTIEVDTEAAVARTLTIEGTLRASRNAPTRLTLYGNLVVRRQGVVDYGRPTDRVTVQAMIRWFLDENLYVGGGTMEPVASDVGLWAIDDAQVWVHGQYRDAWSPLLQTASAGAVEIRVNPEYAQGWQLDDTIVLTPTNPVEGERAVRQDERRRIAFILGPGHFRLEAPLQYTHSVIQTSWTDAWGDTWNETLAGKVANLTSNIRFEAGDPIHRPHIMFLNRAKHYVEDLAVVNFSPTPKFTRIITNQTGGVLEPMARYAWHNHVQEEGSRGSYLRRARFYDGVGNGLVIHESWGIEVTDAIVYNQARFSARINGVIVEAGLPIFIERTIAVPDPPRWSPTCNDSWLDRPLVIGWGQDHRTQEGFGGHGIWTTGARNCNIVGAVVAGGMGSPRSSGVHWQAGGAAGEEVVHVYRAEAFSNRGMGFHSWQNNAPRERVVDLLAWHNNAGLGWGAYQTAYSGHHVRALGNDAQLTHWAVGWRITGFLADGLGRPGAIGIQVGHYGVPSPSDSTYADGVVRNVAMNFAHVQSRDPGSVSWVQFARIAWHPGAGVRFDGSAAPPPGSRIGVRLQRGLARVSNFTLYRRDDPNAPRGAVLDTEYNALRFDNDSTGTVPQTPRVRMVAPADDIVAAGTITLTVESNGPSVQFYQANRLLATVPVVNGRATLSFNMAQHPYRRAYFWALSTTPDGGENTSRVIRVRKF